MEAAFIPGLVTTIIPVYNRPRMLTEAVASVLAQTYRPIEIIVVDDGSTDETAAVANRLAEEHPSEIVARHTHNGGPGVAREAGRQRARGEFIQYLDSDDLLLPDKFRVQVEALRANPDCGIAYGGTRLVGADGELLQAPFKWTGKPIATLFPALLVDRWWSTSTPLLRRSVSDAAGPWSDMRMCEDWEYESRLAALETRLVFCEGFFSDTRSHTEDKLTAGPLTPAKISCVSRLHHSLFSAARRAGIALETPEMRHFARSAFLVARQAAAAGLRDEAKATFDLAVAATVPEARDRLPLRLFRVLASALGWRFAARVSQAAYSLLGLSLSPENLAKSADTSSPSVPHSK